MSENIREVADSFVAIYDIRMHRMVRIITVPQKMQFKTIPDVYRFLDSLPSFQVHGAVAARMGLDRIRAFCDVMGNPERRVPCIHVAGTNGKGSVSALLALAYEQAGCRCGLYTSPHLLQVTERIRINRNRIPEDDFLRFFRIYGADLLKADLSYFEITTAAAFWWFSEQKVDLAVLETGLGGRLDATNVVVAEATVITSIAHDHQNFLGGTLAEIAAEKGGIIKRERPLILGNVPASARRVLEAMADRAGSPVRDVRELRPRYERNKRAGSTGSVYRFREGGVWVLVPSDLTAPVHRWNIAMARMVTHELNHRFQVLLPTFQSAVRNAAQSGLLPARFERLSPALSWYFDGAHNPEAVHVLMDTIRRQEWDCSPVIVMSMMKDKAQKKMLEPFSVFKKNYYYRLEMERAADIALISPYLTNIKNLPPTEDEITEFFEGLTGQVVIFTGSFYFYGVVKRWISRIIKAE